MFRPREVPGGPAPAAAEVPWRLGPVTDVPDTVLEAGRIGSLEVRAASSRGALHRSRGEVRHDAVGVTALGGQVVLAAVASGGHRGAGAAVRHALGYLAWALPDASLLAVDVSGALAAADRAVREVGGGSAELTLAAVDVAPSHGGHVFRAARLGGGLAFLLAQGRFRSLLEGTGGAVQGRLAAGQALVLTSDGVGAPLRATGVGEYLAREWSAPPGPIEYLHHLQFTADPYDDDRTAVGIWATAVPVSGNGDRG